MALSPRVPSIRLLMADLDGLAGSPVLSDTMISTMVEARVFTTGVEIGEIPVGTKAVSDIEVAQDALETLAAFHVDAYPQRARAALLRKTTLGLLQNRAPENYIHAVDDDRMLVLSGYDLDLLADYLATQPRFRGPAGKDSNVPGPQGRQGVSTLIVYISGTEAPARPTGGRIDPATLTVTPPSGWTNTPVIAGSGENLYASLTLVNPAVHTSAYTPEWSNPYEAGTVGADGKQGASAFVGYSADNSSWHESFQAGDLYIRFVVAETRPAEDSSLWPAGSRFVGEPGKDASISDLDKVQLLGLSYEPTRIDPDSLPDTLSFVSENAQVFGTGQVPVWYQVEVAGVLGTTRPRWPAASRRQTIDYTLTQNQKDAIGTSVDQGDTYVQALLVFYSNAAGGLDNLIASVTFDIDLIAAAQAGGDVTTAQLEAEADLRESGDDLQSIVIASAANLTSALDAQATSDNPLIAVFSQPVTLSGTTYAAGLVIFIAPRSRAIERIGEFISPINLSVNRSIARDAAAFTIAVNAQKTDPHMEFITAEATFSATAGTPSGTYQVKAGDLWYMSPFGTVPHLLYRPIPDASKQDALTLQQRAELIDLRLSATAIIPTVANLRKPIEFSYDAPAILGPTLWAELTISGVTPARQAMVQSAGTLTFTLSNAQAQSIANTKDPSLNVRVAIYDASTGGNLLANLHRNITVIPESIPPTVGTLANTEAVNWDTSSFLHANLTLIVNATVTVLAGNDGDTAVLRVKQDATGGRTLALSGVSLAGRTLKIGAAANAETEVFLYRRGGAWKYMGSIEG